MLKCRQLNNKKAPSTSFLKETYLLKCHILEITWNLEKKDIYFFDLKVMFSKFDRPENSCISTFENYKV